MNDRSFFRHCVSQRGSEPWRIPLRRLADREKSQRDLGHHTINIFHAIGAHSECQLPLYSKFRALHLEA